MIRFENITLKYDSQTIVENFSLKIPDSSFCVFTGVSGSGKTSFLNMLAGFVLPQTGKIFFDDIEVCIQNIQKIRRQIAWLPQNFNISYNSVRELFFSVFDLKINKKKLPDEQSVGRILNKLGLDMDILSRRNDELSGGQRQRILLASLILTGKKYLLLDEPTSALDSLSAERLFNVLKSLKGTTVICASHDEYFIENAQMLVEL